MSFSLKNILICGGSGFIGSHFIRHLYNKYPEYRIVNLDLLTYAGNNSNIQDIAEQASKLPPDECRYQFVKGDICDSALLEKLFRQYNFSVVVNFAAESHVDRSIVSAHNFIRTNIQGAHAIVEAARTHKVPKFIQISTDEIYGDVAKGFSHEESPIRPSNPYAASKSSADVLMQAFMRTHRAPIIIFRSSNNLGPNQYPEKLIPLTISSFLENDKVPVHGNGQHIRSWIYVKDFCQALDLVMHQAPLYSIYNVSGNQKTNLEIIKAIAGILGKDANRHVVFTNDRPGADLRYAPSSDKIRRELGWAPHYDFNSALKETVQWYVENPNWWKVIRDSEVFQSHYQKQSKAEYY